MTFTTAYVVFAECAKKMNVYGKATSIAVLILVLWGGEKEIV